MSFQTHTHTHTHARAHYNVKFYKLPSPTAHGPATAEFQISKLPTLIKIILKLSNPPPPRHRSEEPDYETNNPQPNYRLDPKLFTTQPPFAFLLSFSSSLPSPQSPLVAQSMHRTRPTSNQRTNLFSHCERRNQFSRFFVNPTVNIKTRAKISDVVFSKELEEILLCSRTKVTAIPVAFVGRVYCRFGGWWRTMTERTSNYDRFRRYGEKVITKYKVMFI